MDETKKEAEKGSVKTKKKKMRPEKFAAIFVPLSTLSLALAIALPICGDMFHVTIDSAMGLGKLHVEKAEGSENWDTEYNTAKYKKTTDSRLAGASMTEKICDEGFVLLKNKDSALPLAEKSSVSPFGAGYKSPVYGGSGSGTVKAGEDYIVTPKEGLASDFTINSAIESKTEGATLIELEAADGTTPIATSFGGKNTISVIDPSIYTGSEASCSNTTGIIILSRAGGEGQDIKSDGFKDGTKHQLALSDYERNTIKFAKKNCSKVVVVINSSNAMELGELEDGELSDQVDAILWVGGPGSTGFQSMADILCGKVNPSGKTADIYPEDFYKDPAVQNFGDFTYSNTGSKTAPGYFEYEEGIYIGYKYYETAAETGYIDYAKSVVYPFGYGLSYTTFDHKFDSLKKDGNEITCEVTVTNTGKTAGKDIVQLYYTAPFTEYDKQNGIEKASKNLINFGKTKELKAGESEKVTLSWGADEMASYAYRHDNNDGTKGCYILEDGTYTISDGKNSHDIYDAKTLSVSATEVYSANNPRPSEKDAQSILNADGTLEATPKKTQADANATYKAATNEFQESTDYMSQSSITNLSRANFSGTFPTAPSSSSKELAEPYLSNYKSLSEAGFDVKTNAELGNVSTSKVYDDSEVAVKDSGYTLSSLRGKSYYDPEWDTLLDQIDYSDSTVQSQLVDLLYYGAYKTGELTAVGKISTKDYDGPAGFSTFMDQNPEFLMNAYCSEVIIASSFNQDLAKEMGETVGQEALTYGLSGWYAPGMDMHRSPFGGRNFEYYSEDGVLTGKISSSVLSGSYDEGCYAYIKHFAMNEQETHRMLGSMWANEQAIREVYLKPFEIAVKEARGTLKYTSDSKGTKSTKVMRAATAVMTSFTMIGTTMCSSNYALTNTVLRDEWGFEGMVITDFGPAVNKDAMVRAGNDFLLNANWGGKIPAFSAVFADTTSNTAKHAFRTAIKNMCYTTVNSNAFNHIAPGSTSYRDLAPWRVLFNWLTALFAILAATGAGFTIYRYIDFHKNPNKYKEKKQKEEK